MLASPWDCIAGGYSVAMWCDVICIQGKAPVWSTQNGIQVFHIGIDSFRAGGKRRETSTLKWVYSRLSADQKNLVQDANGWDLSVWISPARQLCYQASFTDIKFKQNFFFFFINSSTSHLINGEQSFVLVFSIRHLHWFSFFSLKLISLEPQQNSWLICSLIWNTINILLQSRKCQQTEGKKIHDFLTFLSMKIN